MAMTEQRQILVTGATGKVGRHVVRQLLRTGTATVRALARDPEAAELPAGVEVVRGDLAVPATLDDALALCSPAALAQYRSSDSTPAT